MGDSEKKSIIQLDSKLDEFIFFFWAGHVAASPIGTANAAKYLKDLQLMEEAKEAEETKDTKPIQHPTPIQIPAVIQPPTPIQSFPSPPPMQPFPPPTPIQPPPTKRKGQNIISYILCRPKQRRSRQSRTPQRSQSPAPPIQSQQSQQSHQSLPRPIHSQKPVLPPIQTQQLHQLQQSQQPKTPEASIKIRSEPELKLLNFVADTIKSKERNNGYLEDGWLEANEKRIIYRYTVNMKIPNLQ